MWWLYHVVTISDGELVPIHVVTTSDGELVPIHPKLQALVYNSLPSTTAVFGYTIRSRKLSANKQFFVVSLLQTTQIKQGTSFTATSKVYTSTNKTTNVWNEMELFFF